MVMSIVGVVVVFVVALVIMLTGNGFYFFNKFRSYFPDISGRSFGDIAGGIFGMLSSREKFSILVQLVILFSFLGFGLFKTIKHKKRPILKKSTFSKKNFDNEAQTDLDILYNALAKKKEISLEDIALMFKVDKELALDWCKTLENADLAIVDYPNFKPPILRLPEEEKEEGEDDKNKDDKKSKKAAKKQELTRNEKKLKKNLSRRDLGKTVNHTFVKNTGGKVETKKKKKSTKKKVTAKKRTARKNVSKTKKTAAPKSKAKKRRVTAKSPSRKKVVAKKKPVQKKKTISRKSRVKKSSGRKRR